MPAHSFERLSAFPALWAAWQAYRRGKRRCAAVAMFDMDADLNVLSLHRDLRTGRYSPSPYRVRLVQDPKTRLIAAPAVRDRVLQRALLNTIGPTYERSFIDHSYAVCSGRGVHRAVLACVGWMRRFRFRLHLDVRHYFASIDHARLLALFGRRLSDPRTLALVSAMLQAGAAVYRHPLAGVILGDATTSPGRGLPLGGYLSHWSGGLYLDGLDHHVKRVLRVPGYLRYMDDFVLFGDDYGALERARDDIADWLHRERGLMLKERRMAPVDNGRAGEFLGFRVGRGGLGPGHKALLRLRRRLRSTDEAGLEHLVRGLRAFRGMWGALES